jgi:dethiobiotin synthetase
MSVSYKRKVLFVTGTDTGVGKTLVAAGLIRLARIRGLRGLGVKPMETGCSIREGVLYPADGAFLQEAAENDLTLDECAPFRFSLPASPARAAAMEGRRLAIAEIEEHIRAVVDSSDFTVVEGAGGLMVPIQGDLMMIDLIRRLGCPALLVGRTRLGTVNHTLLSLNALQHHDITPAGIVLSCSVNPAGPEEAFTPADLSRLVKDVPVMVLPYVNAEAATDSSKVAEIMAASWPDEVIDRWLGLTE